MDPRRFNPASLRRLHRVVRDERERAFADAAVRLGLVPAAEAEAGPIRLAPADEARVWAEVESVEAVAPWVELMPVEVRRAAAISVNRVKEFVLVERIGKGGGGEVWKAWDAHLARWVAVKWPRVQGNAAVWERFRQEAMAAARLQHPGIVTIFRADEDFGRPFLAMRYIEGRSLDGHRATPREAADLIRRAAEAVDHAHRHGIVHRDLKPANVMLGAGGEVLILDFGLAALQEGGKRLTAEGQAVGTPMYMAPEQAMGLPSSRRPTVDVYGLGVTLYEVSTGSPPFDVRNYAQIVGKVTTEDPKLPSVRVPGFPSDLEQVILRAMEKIPDRRYATAEALAADLRRFLAGEPVEARGGSTARRFFRRAVRRPPAVAAAAAILLLVAGTAWVVAASASTRSRAAEHTRLAREAEARGDFESAYHHWQTVHDLDRRNAEARAGRDRASAEVLRRRRSAERMEAERRARAHIAAVRAALDRAQGIHYQAQPDFRELRDVCFRVKDRIEEALKEFPDLVEGHVLLGRAWQLLGDEDRAVACWEEALKRDPGHGPAHLLLGRWRFQEAIRTLITGATLGLHERLLKGAALADAAAESLRRAVELKTPLAGPLEERVAQALVESFRKRDGSLLDRLDAWAAEFRGRQGSEDLLLLAAIGSEAREGLDKVDAALAIKPHDDLLLLLRASLLADLGMRKEAAEGFDRVTEVAPGSWIGWQGRAEFRTATGDFQGAYDDYGVLEERHPRHAGMAAAQRGDLLLRMGRTEEGLASLRESRERHPREPLVRVVLGNHHARRKEFGEAIREYTEAIGIEPSMSEAFLLRGIAYLQMKENARAIQDLRTAVSLRPRAGAAWLALGTALFADHQDAEAERAALEAKRVGVRGREAEVDRLIENIRSAR